MSSPSLTDAQTRELMANPLFRVFLFDIATASGLMTRHHEEQKAGHYGGRRSLGLDIFGWLSSESAEPFDVLVKAYEAAKINPKEAKRDQSRYDDDPS